MHGIQNLTYGVTASVLASRLKRVTSPENAYQKMPTHGRRPPSILPRLLTRLVELQVPEEVSVLAHPGHGW